MTVSNYMNLLGVAERMTSFVHNNLKSEMIDKLVINYEVIFKATNNDEGDKIMNRLLALMGA